MDWNDQDNQRLIQAILTLKTGDEVGRFLRDIMTEKEIEEFAKRLQAAVLLSEKISYAKIEQVTGLSSTTVARVAKWLKGPGGGYRTVINRLHHHNPIQTGRGLS